MRWHGRQEERPCIENDCKCVSYLKSVEYHRFITKGDNADKDCMSCGHKLDWHLPGNYITTDKFPITCVCGTKYRLDDRILVDSGCPNNNAKWCHCGKCKPNPQEGCKCEFCEWLRAGKPKRWTDADAARYVAWVLEASGY